jgi:hypothetical protein
MAGMYASIAREVAQQVRTSGLGLATTVGGGHTYVDSSTNFSGPVYVEANDPNALARQLADKARLKKLTRPPRATAAASCSSCGASWPGRSRHGSYNSP